MAPADVSETAVAFVRAGRPPTANKPLGTRGGNARRQLGNLYKDAGGPFMDGSLYGVVYYFVSGYRSDTDADADNVSKPVWDALEGVAYADDKVVRLRIAGVIDSGPTGNGAPTVADLGRLDMPRHAAQQLYALLESGERHILYTELGALRPDMFVFNLSGRGGERCKSTPGF